MKSNRIMESDLGDPYPGDVLRNGVWDMGRLLAVLLLAIGMMLAPACFGRKQAAPVFFSLLFPQFVAEDQSAPQEATWGEAVRL